VKLTTHLQLVPRLRVSGAIPLLHSYACKAPAETILPFLPFTSLYIYNLFACNHSVISHNMVEPRQNDFSDGQSHLLVIFFFSHKLAAHMQDHRPTGMWWDKQFLKSFTRQWTNSFLNPSRGSEKSARTLNGLFCNSTFYFQIRYD